MIQLARDLLQSGTIGLITVCGAIATIMVLFSFIIVRVLPTIAQKIKIKGLSLPGGSKADYNENNKQDNIISNIANSIRDSFISGIPELRSIEDNFIDQLIQAEKNFFDSIQKKYNHAINSALNKMVITTREQIDTDIDDEKIDVLELTMAREVKKAFEPVLDDIEDKLEKNIIIDSQDLNKMRDSVIFNMRQQANSYSKISRSMVLNIITDILPDAAYKIIVEFIESYKDLYEAKQKNIEKFSVNHTTTLDMWIRKHSILEEEKKNNDSV